MACRQAAPSSRPEHTRCVLLPSRFLSPPAWRRRNHKLTMLMSDSLGGNAKTLMFVNVAPSESNLDESMNSLVYATRVRTIKNNALRDEANKEVLR